MTTQVARAVFVLYLVSQCLFSSAVLATPKPAVTIQSIPNDAQWRASQPMPDAVIESVKFPSESAYNLMGWSNTLGVVERLQTIHRLALSHSSDAINALARALDSPCVLARRKASQYLFEKAKTPVQSERHVLAERLAPSIQNPDPFVQKNTVKSLSVLNTISGNVALNQFFTDSPKQAQLNALDGLRGNETFSKQTLRLVTQISPYPEVRQAAKKSLVF